MSVMDKYIRAINKNWSDKMRETDDGNPEDPIRIQIMIDSIHMVRVAVALMHPIAPKGTEMVREYLRFDESFWSWDHIFEECYFFMEDPKTHKLKFLEPRVDFFEKHPTQIKDV
jgi:methionyl-tRNA synthetase